MATTTYDKRELVSQGAIGCREHGDLAPHTSRPWSSGQPFVVSRPKVACSGCPCRKTLWAAAASGTDDQLYGLRRPDLGADTLAQDDHQADDGEQDCDVLGRREQACG